MSGLAAPRWPESQCSDEKHNVASMGAHLTCRSWCIYVSASERTLYAAITPHARSKEPRWLRAVCAEEEGLPHTAAARVRS